MTQQSQCPSFDRRITWRPIPCGLASLVPVVYDYEGNFLEFFNRILEFYGRTPDELRQEFKNSVEEYLAWCAEEGTIPEKTWLGKLTLRLDDNLRRRLAVVAAAHDESINSWVTSLLDRETKRLLEEHM